jgi:hypothetical protein
VVRDTNQIKSQQFDQIIAKKEPENPYVEKLKYLNAKISMITSKLPKPSSQEKPVKDE